MAQTHSGDPRTVVIGECLIDVVKDAATGMVTEHVGGSPANVAIGLSRLGHPTSLMTAFGTDPHGEMIRHALEADGVTYLPGSSAQIPTSVAYATIGEDGSATYDFDLHWQLDASAPAADHVHTGSIGAALDSTWGSGGAEVRRLVRALSRSATVSYDPNVRPALMGCPQTARAAFEEIIQVADCVKASDEDLAWCYPQASLEQVAKHWLDLGAGLVVITCGEEGMIAFNRNGNLRLDAKRVKVVDTIGAGDSCMSGLISGLLDRGLLGDVTRREALREATMEQVEPALRRALACAAITVSRAGAQPPTHAELSAE